jgi:hypothetical protein
MAIRVHVASMRSRPARDWDVQVIVPAEATYARVVRTVAATCAVLEGFDVDRVDDVRLLVDEVFVAMLTAGARRIDLRLALADGCVAMELVADHEGGRRRRDADAGFVHTLADVMATDVRIELDHDPPRFAATMGAC